MSQCFDIHAISLSISNTAVVISIKLLFLCNAIFFYRFFNVISWQYACEIT